MVGVNDSSQPTRELTALVSWLVLRVSSHSALFYIHLTVRNSLPESVRSAETLASFKHKLTTYLFNISF